MDDKMSKVVKRVVKELESALKSEKKIPDNLDVPEKGTPEQLVECYLSEQIPEREWQEMLRDDSLLYVYWLSRKDVNREVKETEVMADNAVRTTFEEIIEVVLAHEGGFVDDPDDKGGATNWGVTQAVWEDFLEDEFTSEDVKVFAAVRQWL